MKKNSPVTNKEHIFVGVAQLAKDQADDLNALSQRMLESARQYQV